MNNSENLTFQQQRFCDEYLVSFNAYSAAVCAGYSENTVLKGELLHLPKIQAYLKIGMAKNRERLLVSHDMILRELAKIAFSNMGNYYDENATLKPMSLLTTDEKAAISYYQIMDSLDQNGNRVGEFSRIKLHNKMSALDKIARHVGFYTEKKQGSSESGVESLEPLGEKAVAGSEAFLEDPEAKSLGQDQDGLVVNGDGVLVAEVAADGDLVQVEVAGGLEGSCVTTVEKILTLSPLDNGRCDAKNLTLSPPCCGGSLALIR